MWSASKYAQKKKAEVIDHYGGVCACCGEDRKVFLAIDHIGGGGEQEHQKHGWGTQFYRWLIKNNFPDGYRVLCHNCNFAYRMGECPHNIGS